MGVYGESAVRAVELIRTGECPDPPAAWDRAAGETCCSKSTAAKTGPRCAFLGLCEEGLVEGVPAGNYCMSILNKQYALDGLMYLREAEEKRRTREKGRAPASSPGHRYVPTPMVLWRHVNAGVAHSGQMDVVVTLWKEGYIE
ncbi:DUF6979 family protein [Methanovulcanius yangii]|uniref:DUF6979 family protein n=1 Tax=Methanovulcanius yangii TaxID=1789227 RepID=UPI0029C9B875|nr:hypothetical protein [Methanovulcanius yangii]